MITNQPQPSNNAANDASSHQLVSAKLGNAQEHCLTDDIGPVVAGMPHKSHIRPSLDTSVANSCVAGAGKKDGEGRGQPRDAPLEIAGRQHDDAGEEAIKEGASVNVEDPHYRREWYGSGIEKCDEGKSGELAGEDAGLPWGAGPGRRGPRLWGRSRAFERRIVHRGSIDFERHHVLRYNMLK